MSTEKLPKKGRAELRVRPRGKTRTIQVDTLTRVEGEGGLFVKTSNGKVENVELRIFEPPRFFEALLVGRSHFEAPDITSRICGICPVAYLLSSARAMEQGLGLTVTSTIRELRKLMMYGEWIESHSLHVYMLHSPDFLKFPDAIQMARKYPDTVKRGLRLKKIGNEIMRIIGGREINPVNFRVGGFYRFPDRGQLRSILDDLKWARDASIETAKWVATLEFPDFERDYEFVAVSHPDEYGIVEGRIISNRGLDVDVSAYDQHFTEMQVPHSTALQAKMNGRGSYVTGPLARYNLNYDKLSPLTREVAESIGFPRTCLNPFKTIVIRALELVQACDEGVRMVESYEPEGPPYVKGAMRAFTGYGASEAPRGLLFHSYRVSGDGFIEKATIVPPTSQNQRTIEEDVMGVVEGSLHLSKEELTLKCEQAIRNYDPCISCSAHFLRLEIEEG